VAEWCAEVVKKIAGEHVLNPLRDLRREYDILERLTHTEGFSPINASIFPSSRDSSIGFVS